MRVVSLQLGGGLRLELHPFVSIAPGLTPEQRRVVVDAVGRLTSGGAPAAAGQLEAFDVLLPLDATGIELLDLGHTPVDAVVRREHLPGAGLSTDARTLRARQQALDELDDRIDRLRREADLAEQVRTGAAEALHRAQRAHDHATGDATARIVGVDQLTARIDELAERRRRLDEQLVQARRVVGEAAAERRRVEEATAATRADYRHTVDEATRAAARLEDARAARDPFAAAAVEEARAQLAEAERELQLAREAIARASVGEVHPQARLEQIQARMEELHDLLRVLLPADPTPVIEALALLRDLENQEHVPSPEAYALADELEKVEARLDEVGDGPGADGALVATARARLDEARGALLEAEQGARIPELDRDQVETLEHAHGAVLDALDKAEARFGGGRAKKRVDDAREEERRILDELGFATYADYLMGTSMLNVDPDSEARLDSARAELADAEDEWRELQLALDVDLERGTLLDRRRELRENARDVLGTSARAADLPAALRALRVPAVPAGEAEVRLRAALDVVGLPLADEDLAGDDLIHLAETWLEEDARSADKRTEVVAELDELAAARATLDAALANPVPSGPDDVDLDASEQLEADARRELAIAEQRLAAHTGAEADVAALERALSTTAEAERRAAGPAEAADRDVEAAAATERTAVEHLAELEADAAAAAATEAAAAEELRRLETGHPTEQGSWLQADERTHQVALEDAEARVAEARGVLGTAERERDSLIDEIEALRRTVEGTSDGVPAADEVEWYLLARLAAQRSVTYAGSVPLVIDGAFDGLDDLEVTRLLERVERMAQAVQIVILSDHPALAKWADSAGIERAATVRPEPLGATA